MRRTSVDNDTYCSSQLARMTAQENGHLAPLVIRGYLFTVIAGFGVNIIFKSHLEHCNEIRYHLVGGMFKLVDSSAFLLNTEHF